MFLSVLRHCAGRTQYWCRNCCSKPSEECRNRGHYFDELEEVQEEAHSRLLAADEEARSAREALAEAERELQAAQDELKALTETNFRKFLNGSFMY